MRPALGPFLTTAVALVVATVVVVNPVVTKPTDVQIPAVQLSANSGASVGTLGRSLLDSIAPAPAESTSPLAILKQLFAALAEDATDIGKKAILEAFVAGTVAVTQPELTAESIPYVAPYDPVDPINGPTILIAPISPTSVPTSFVQEVTPALESVLTSVVQDAGYVGGQAVAAAFAAGAVVAAEPKLITKAFTALATGDIQTALRSAVQAVMAPLGPPLMIINALRAVLQKRWAQLTGVVSPPAQQLVTDVRGSQLPTPAAVSATITQPLTTRGVIQRKAPPPRASAGDSTASAAAAGGRTPNGATNLNDGNKAVPGGNKAGLSAVRDALAAVGGQVRQSIKGLGDTLARSAGPRGDAGAGAPAERPSPGAN